MSIDCERTLKDSDTFLWVRSPASTVPWPRGRVDDRLSLDAIMRYYVSR